MPIIIISEIIPNQRIRGNGFFKRMCLRTKVIIFHIYFLGAGIMKSHLFKTKIYLPKKTGTIDVNSSFIRMEKILFST